jgi:hypothetical protein
MELQKHIFKAIKDQLPKHLTLVDVIEELFGKGTDSAYRRIRGETELSLSELQKICQKYNLSLDEFIHSKSREGALFQCTVVDKELETYVNYLTVLQKMLDHLKSAPKKEFIFTALDIPFYYFFEFPELAYFRYYVWYKTMEKNAGSFEHFCNTLPKDRIKPIYEQIQHDILYIPSREIWTEYSMDTTLKLLKYYDDIGAFESKDTLIYIVNQLFALSDRIGQYASDGYKESNTKTTVQVYHCSVDVENYFMLIRNDHSLSCLTRLYAGNSIVTENEFVCVQVQRWIENLISKSILISGDGAFKERKQFLDSLRTKVQNFMNEIG